MSALRKAGVWLGLIEDESDAYEERELTQASRDRGRVRQREAAHEFEDEYGDPDDLPPARTRGPGGRGVAGRDVGRADTGRDVGRADAGREVGRDAHPDWPGERMSARRPERGDDPRGNVRSITREASGREPAGRDTSVSHLTRDNLALAPQVQAGPAERATGEEERRYQITTLHPTTYREARTIGEHFREGTPVIMNLTEMDEADARRLVDFGAGLAFGLRGNMERVTNRVFLLSPANVHVTAEDKAKIAEGEFFQHR